MLRRSIVGLALVGSAASFSLQGAARLTTLHRSMGLVMDEVPACNRLGACRLRTPFACSLEPIARPVAPQAAASPLASNVWESSPAVKVQGSTLKTWDIGEESTQRVQLSLRSEGRPIDANIELWHTPSYIPTKFRIYTEDGVARPVDAIIETPKHPKTVAVYNTGPTQTLALGPNPFVSLGLAVAVALAPTLA